MSHDLIAELAGYRNELAGYLRAGSTERAAAVREQMAAVTAAISGEADRLVARAENHEQAGQDVLAARARVEARRLRHAVDDAEVVQETAADATPRETAVTRKRAPHA